MESIKVFNQNCHLQGFTSDKEHKYMFWSFTDSLVKTTISGTVICQVHLDGGHLGGLDWHDGKIYASFLCDPSPWTFWGDWSAFYVYVFDETDLSLIRKIEIKECKKLKDECYGGFNGIDGIAFGKVPGTEKTAMFVACALSNGEEYINQMILQVTLDGEVEHIYKVQTGNTVFGIQNLDYEEDTGNFWITTYNQSLPYQAEETLYCISPEIDRVLRKYKFSTPYGFEALGNGEFYCSLQSGKNGHREGTAYRCREDFFATPKTEDEVNEYVEGKLKA